MIKIQTFRLEPYLPVGATNEKLTSEWLRDIINRLMRDKRDKLEEEKPDISLFFNHNQETGHTRIGYPLIIYHFIDGLFYITGINEGAKSLAALAKHYKSPFSIDGVLFHGFIKEKSDEVFKLETIGEMRSYGLIGWRPIHHTDLKAYLNSDMITKVKELNNRLEKHITNELGKYLGINFNPINCVITDITRVYEPSIYKKRHSYIAFDIHFSANIAFPCMITLGNHQALGFGRVVPL